MHFKKCFDDLLMKAGFVIGLYIHVHVLYTILFYPYTRLGASLYTGGGSSIDQNY